MKSNFKIILLSAIAISCLACCVAACSPTLIDGTDQGDTTQNNGSIEADNSQYLYQMQSDGTINITGMTGDMSVNSVLTIPEEIDGHDVTKIGSSAFSASLDRYGIITVNIPDSVKEIGDGAFNGCKEIERVNISEDSNLVKVGDYCFSWCDNLQKIDLPDCLEEIGFYAFYNCSALNNVNLGDNVLSIGLGAFINCDSLNNIIVSADNQYYAVENGVLLSKDRTRLLSYSAENGSPKSFVVPDTVIEIESGAFCNNKSLDSVDLNNVTAVRQGAFRDCTNLSSVVSDEVNVIERRSFDGTKWLEDNYSFAAVGNVVYSCQGIEAHVDLSGYFSVTDYAAFGNANIKSVTFDNAMRNIGSFAFSGCPNLEAVYINNLNNIVYVGTSTFENASDSLTIYVPQRNLHEYEDNGLWQQYAAKLDVHNTLITYNLNGGNVDGQASFEGSIQYGGYLSLPIPEKEGYVLGGWYESPDLIGEAVINGELWISYAENYELYAKWIAGDLQFTITYHPDGGEMDFLTQTYTADEEVTYLIPQRQGYRFIGWYHDEEFTKYAGEGFPAGNTGDLDLYARWEKI